MAEPRRRKRRHREGLGRTGRVVTAAAAVMIAVFGAFALSGNRVLELFAS